MSSRRFKYTHWLRFNSFDEKKQWQNLKEYKDKYDCYMTVFYYDYNPLTDKVVKLDCNQSYQELDLDVNSMSDGSFKKLTAKPTNVTPYNKGIDYFFNKKLGLEAKPDDQIEVSKQESNDKEQGFIPVDVLTEFSHLKNIEFFDKLAKKEGWQVVKKRSDRGFHYQLYFGKEKQVDNRYEFAFSKFTYKSRMAERFQMFINHKKKQLDNNLNKYVGRKLNLFESSYQFETGEKINIDIVCVGLVLGINNNSLDIYDVKKPLRQQFYSISIDDFMTKVDSGLYKPNYNLLCDYEKIELKKYNRNRLKKFTQLCGDWDYRNIDMTEPHLEGISIKDNIIFATCEKFSTELDDYVIGSPIEINNENLLKEFRILDLSQKEKVLEYISKIEIQLDFKSINKELYQIEQEEIKESFSKEEMEIEYD